jgi:hypothetical protein
MTQDEIIEMARQAGMYQDLNVSWNQSIQNFAKLAFEKGRQQGMKQERALWELSKITQELGPIETYIEKKAKGEA